MCNNNNVGDSQAAAQKESTALDRSESKTHESRPAEAMDTEPIDSHSNNTNNNYNADNDDNDNNDSWIGDMITETTYYKAAEMQQYNGMLY